ncbi:MAG: hypothetical protein KAT70_03615 [Thermoplasmata archaeon]|nr:hypothetical protein [Thermoplasmata archaeon]
MRRNSVFALLVLFSLALFALAQSPLCLAQEEDEVHAPVVSGIVTPSTGTAGSDFLFTATYRDADNDTALYVRVVIEGQAYDMIEVNPDDRNYTDGKEYSFRIKMIEGPSAFYFTASDGDHTAHSPVRTLNAEGSGLLSGRHMDLIIWGSLIVPFLLLFLIVALLQVRGMRKSLDALAGKKDDGEEKRTNGEGVGGEERTGEEGEGVGGEKEGDHHV